jgi:type VI protein secretion system component Hcp
MRSMPPTGQLDQLGQRIRILAFFIAAVLLAGAFLAVTQPRTQPARAPHFLGLRQLQLDAASGKARLLLRIPSLISTKPGAPRPPDLVLTSVSWGVSNPAQVGSGAGGAGAGKITFNPFSITRKTDAASPKLFQAAATGTHFAGATILVIPPGAKTSADEELEYQLKSVVVSSATESSNGNGSGETIGLAYSGLTEDYLQKGKVVSTIIYQLPAVQ